MARGLRNNNPGNIRRSAVRYKGEVASADGAFKQFESAAWGYRAMFMLLHTYRVRRSLDTLRRMIGRYAPPVENDTAAYVSFVAARAAVDADAPLDTLSRVPMVAVVAAMSRVENGADAIAADVEAGWELFIADAG
jgi:hypothetical protein